MVWISTEAPNSLCQLSLGNYVFTQVGRLYEAKTHYLSKQVSRCVGRTFPLLP